MTNASSGYIIGYHGCDKDLAIRLLVGADQLKPSENVWDWLGGGIYFWENDPIRALQYSNEVTELRQPSFTKISTPFVIGAVIDLGNCLNLVEVNSLNTLSEAYQSLSVLMQEAMKPLPRNNKKNRTLDCTVLNYLHESNIQNNIPPYDSVRCAFPEGRPAFPGSSITEKLHIQLCIRNPSLIKGYFLPRPLLSYNPNLS